MLVRNRSIDTLPIHKSYSDYCKYQAGSDHNDSLEEIGCTAKTGFVVFFVTFFGFTAVFFHLS